jgi:hypothetical protein
MQQLGWSEGRNVQIDVGWGADDIDLEQKNAAELVALTPDVVFASGTLSVAALRRLNRTVTIVFANVTDPLGGSSTALIGPRQYDGIYDLRIQSEREMASATQRNCAKRDAGSHS